MNESEKSFDALMLADIWRLEDLAPFREFSKQVMGIFIDTLADYHGLSARQMRFLANASAEIAIAIFCDAIFRINKQNLYKIKEVNVDLEDHIEVFINECKGRHSGYSRVLRCKLMNLLLWAYGKKTIDESVIGEPQKITLGEMLKNEKLINGKYRTDLSVIHKYIWQGSQSFKNLFDSYNFIKSAKRYRLGVVSPECFGKSIVSVKGIDWVRVKWKDHESDIDITAGGRLKLFRALEREFINKCMDMAMPQGEDDGIKEKLLKVLFAVLITIASDNIINREKLLARIASLGAKLSDLKINGIIAKSSWGNGLVAATAAGIHLPVILVQMGGGFGVQDYIEGFYEMQLGYVDHYLGFGWDREKTGITSTGIARLHKYTEPELLFINQFGKKHNFNKVKGKILFSPCVHSTLYRTELWSHYYPDNTLRIRSEMKKLFGLLSKNDNDYYKYEIYVKFKAFFFNIFKNYEYLFGLHDFPQGTNVRCLTKGVAYQYYPYFQLNLLDNTHTGLLHGLVYNIPTVAFWDITTIKILPQAEPVFRGLREQGVLGVNAEEMAESVRRFMHFPDEWHKHSVQNVRREYLTKFARIDSDWQRQFIEVIDKICNKPERIQI